MRGSRPYIQRYKQEKNAFIVVSTSFPNTGATAKLLRQLSLLLLWESPQQFMNGKNQNHLFASGEISSIFVSKTEVHSPMQARPCLYVHACNHIGFMVIILSVNNYSHGYDTFRTY